MSYYTSDRLVNVSEFDAEGWWIKNGVYQAKKNFGLPKRMTDVIYTPSKKNKIAKFDLVTKKWSKEVRNKRLDSYYNFYGVSKKYQHPDSVLPDLHTAIKPPTYDPTTHHVWFNDKESKWIVYENKVGANFYDVKGNMYTCGELRFELPDNYSWDAKPADEHGFGHTIEKGKWVKKKDLIGHYAYPKDGSKGRYLIMELGDKPYPDEYELFPDRNQKPFHKYDDAAKAWVYDKNLEKSVKEPLEKEWVIDQLLRTSLELSMDLFKKHHNYENYKPLKAEKVKKLIKYLNNLLSYEKDKSFPFGKRPTI